MQISLVNMIKKDISASHSLENVNMTVWKACHH